MAAALTKVKVFPTGMRLNEYVALEEGFWRAEGLEVEMLWDVLKGQMLRWKDAYKERPQDPKSKEMILDDHRVIWVIVAEKDEATHLRLSGPSATVGKHYSAFESFVKGLK